MWGSLMWRHFWFLFQFFRAFSKEDSYGTNYLGTATQAEALKSLQHTSSLCEGLSPDSIGVEEKMCIFYWLKDPPQ